MGRPPMDGRLYARTSRVAREIGAKVDAAFKARTVAEIPLSRRDVVVALSILAECNFCWTFRPGPDNLSPCIVTVDFRECS